MSALTLFNILIIAPTVLVFAFHYLDWTDVQLVNERLDTDAAIESIRVVLDRMLRAHGMWTTRIIEHAPPGDAYFTVQADRGEWTTTLVRKP